MTTSKSISSAYWFYPLIVLLAVSLVVTVALIERPTRDQEEALCVKAVEAILHSTDLVEVTRASIILRETSCSLRRHLG
jgi:hypothetical protein